MYGRKERRMVGMRKRDNFEDQGVEWRIILRWIFMKWDGGVDWIDLAEERDRW